MAQQLNTIPNYPVPLQIGKNTSKDWYFFWSGLFRGLPPAAVAAVTPGVSPYIYSAPVRGSLIVSGGTVSAIAFSRDGTTFYVTGQTAGMFLLAAADQLRITYTVLPTVTFVPV
jgi:hypothetical protein